MKHTKRKAFNFFRSYYDVFNELESEDRLAFIEALLEMQFQGKRPENLTGMAKFAYISQSNSIDSQVKGYNDKQKALKRPQLGHSDNSLNPYYGDQDTPAYGGKVTPAQQEKEKEQVQVQVQVQEQEEVEEKEEYQFYSAFKFLEDHKTSLLEIWTMQNQKQIKDFEDFKNKFDIKIESEILKEELEPKPDIIFNRLKSFGAYWISNSKKYNPTPEPNSYESGKQPRV